MANPEGKIQQTDKKKSTNVNTSGKGANAQVPSSVSKKFNWGAFFFFELWGFCNKQYIAIVGVVLSFIPFLGILINLGMRIYYGINGNKWAWQNNYYPSVSVFHESQQRWCYAILYYLIFVAVIGILWTVFFAAMFSSFMNLGGMGGSSLPYSPAY